MAGAPLVLMTELENLIREQKFDAAIKFLVENKDNEQLQHQISFNTKLLYLLSDIPLPVDTKQNGLEIAAELSSFFYLFRLLLECRMPLMGVNLGASIPIALNYAVDKGNEAVVFLLLTNGVKANPLPDHAYGEFHSPLYFAVRGSHVSIARLLLEHGADIHRLGADIHERDYGQTPLCQAVRQGDEAMVRLLLECDADVTEPNNVGLTALDWAKISESKSILQLLLDAIAAKKEREQKASRSSPSSSSSSSLSSSPHLIHRTLNDKQSKAASGNSPKVEQKESFRIGNA